MRRLGEQSTWPKQYNDPVRCWRNRLQAEHIVDTPVALPHEMLHSISQYSNKATFASTTIETLTTAKVEGPFWGSL